MNVTNMKFRFFIFSTTSFHNKSPLSIGQSTLIDDISTDVVFHEPSVQHNPMVETFGVFQQYPTGVFNPAFTGMFLLDYSNYKDLSEYKICKFHSIKSGIIVKGNEAFVFTPLTNNDINSYLKILLRNKTLSHSSMTKAKATKLIVDYIRCNCRKPVIPSLHIIKNYLRDIVGLSETTFVGDLNTFNTLLYRIYVFMYMLHYHMPLQRTNSPGNRNLASSVNCGRRRGWYSYLSGKEQKILCKESIFISSNSIPDDLINGIPISLLVNSKVMASEDQKNNCMIRDGSSDCMIFQQGIKSHAHKHAEMSAKNKSVVSEKCRKIDELKDIPIVGAMKKQLKSSTGIRPHAHKDARMFPTHIPTVSENCNKPDKSEEVPNIEALKEQVKSYIVGHKITSPRKTRETWNDKFHKLLIGCDIKKYYLASNLPGCYKPGDSCGHILHIDLEDTACNTLQLTMLESVSNRKFSHSLEVASSFINSLTFDNPVWDLGLQFAVAKTNSEKLFNLKKESSQKYLSTCICPCSSLFKYWHATCAQILR